MTAFLLGAIALTVLALGFVTRPLWTPRPLVGAALTAMLAAAAALLYTLVGTPDALDASRRETPKTLADAITQLEAELRERPEQAEGWRLLARAYASEGRLADARDAYARAVKLAPDADVLVEAAEMRAEADPARRFDAQAVAMLRQALQLQPANQRARWFLGIAHRQANRPADAARTWEPLLSMVDAKTAATLRAQVDAARTDAGLAPLPAPAAPATGPGLRIEVSLAPSVAASLPKGASVFVLAPAPGTRMPVAVEKLPAAAFPLTVTLDDTDSLMPTRTLSSLDQVEVVAHVSASGNATPEPGDLEAAAHTVERTSKAPVSLVIDRVVR